MGQGSDRLHLDGVTVFERVVQDTGGIDHLPAQVLVIHVSNEQRLGGESIGLDIDISTGNLVHERRLPDVGVSADEQSTGVGVDRGETGQMLTDLLQVSERILLATHDGGHSSEGSLLELLATVERVTKLEETNIILSDLVNQVASSVHLTQSQLVMVLVVKDVHQVGVEGVNILELSPKELFSSIRSTVIIAKSCWVRDQMVQGTYIQLGELVQNILQLKIKVLLGELDLAHVEVTDTTDGKVGMDNL